MSEGGAEAGGPISGRGRGRSGELARPRPSGPVRARLALALATLLLVAACGPDADPSEGSSGQPSPVGVAVSVPPLGWFVEAVGADLVDVTVLVPPGASPAMYEPTVHQLRRLDRADLWITVGHPRFPFEVAWKDRLARGRPDLRVVGAGADCDREVGDPHLWTSPACARKIVDRIAGALVEARPADLDSVRAGRRRALATVEAVDRELRGRLAPHRGRAFLVFHPALGYLADDYGLDQMAIQRGATEPGPAELDRLVRAARKRGVRQVFVQPQFSQEAARTVARALQEGEVVEVDPLSGDWPAALREIGRALEAAFSAVPSGPTP